MADNLNVQNDPAIEGVPSGNPPLGSEQTQSPLEQSGVTETSVTPPPPSVTGNPAPPANAPDMGESSTPPSTDEFLNSILEQKPQDTSAQMDQAPTAQAAETPPPIEANGAPLQTEPAPPLNNPLEVPQNVNQPINNPLEPPQEMSQPNPEPFPVAPEAAAPIPQPEMASPAPEEIIPPTAYSSSQGSSGLSDGIALDGVPSAQPPTQAPQPPTTDNPVSSSPFTNPPQQGAGGGGMKKIILILLALVVLGGGYYAYTVFAGGSSTKDANTKSPSAVANKTSTGLTAKNQKDVQRKTDLAVIKDALMNYKAGSGQYPAANTLVMLNAAGNVLEQALVPNFLAKMPTDPDTTKAYAYKSDGMTFALSAVLDDSTDTEAVMESGKAIYQLTSSTSSTTPGVSTSSSVVVTSPVAGATVQTYPASGSGNVDDAAAATTLNSDVPPTLNSNF